MKRHNKRTLSLQGETIRALTSDKLIAAAGGISRFDCGPDTSGYTFDADESCHTCRTNCGTCAPSPTNTCNGCTLVTF